MTFSSGPQRDPQSENLAHYFKEHTRETISYILLILGIILLFFDSIWGGVLVGLVAGVYFGDELVLYIRNWQIGVEYRDVTRNLLIIGVAIAFFISAPAIFFGVAAAIAIKYLFVPKETESIKKKEEVVTPSVQKRETTTIVDVEAQTSSEPFIGEKEKPTDTSDNSKFKP